MEMNESSQRTRVTHFYLGKRDRQAIIDDVIIFQRYVCSIFNKTSSKYQQGKMRSNIS